MSITAPRLPLKVSVTAAVSQGDDAMNHGRPRWYRAAVLMFGLVCLAMGSLSCGSSGATTPAPAVLISPRAAALTLTQPQQFVAVVKNSAGSSVIWAVDGIEGGDPNAGTISTSGLYLPPANAGQHIVTVTLAGVPTQQASATVAVTDFPGTFTYHNDVARTGQNLQELALTPANVNSHEFGKLFSCPLDGYVYAQPLYVASLSIPGQGTHNVLYLATEHDSVFAFDADDPACKLIWKTSFINPGAGITTVPNGDVNSNDIVPEIGITGTPVIDISTGTLYVLAKTKEPGPVYAQRLHALDLTSGLEKFGGPSLIQASVPGKGVGADNHGNVNFDPLVQNQRAALLLSGGAIYAAFASHGDQGTFHGWLIGFSASTLQITGVFNDTPDGADGGIWLSGGGPVADSSGNIFLTTGNGTFDANSGGRDFGNSFLRLTAARALSVADYFTPFDQQVLNQNDSDVGSGGPELLPDRVGVLPHLHLLVSAGKQGVGYLVDRDNLGGFRTTDNSQIVESLQLTSSGLYSTPAIWNNNLYVAGSGDVLKQYQFAGGKLSASPLASGNTVFGFPGPSLVISANDSSAGILWGVDNTGYGVGGPAILHAFDAGNVTTELYNTQQNSSRDQAGLAVKFAVPTVANGRVYVGNQSQFTVYGLLP